MMSSFIVVYILRVLTEQLLNWGQRRPGFRTDLVSHQLLAGPQVPRLGAGLSTPPPLGQLALDQPNT